MFLEKYLDNKIERALEVYHSTNNTDAGNDLRQFFKGKLETLTNIRHDLEKLVECPRCKNSFTIVKCSLCSGEKLIEKCVADKYNDLQEDKKSMASATIIQKTVAYLKPTIKAPKQTVMDTGDVSGMMHKKDQVNHPDHYIEGGIEAIDIIKAKLTKEQFEGYLLGNVLKYTLRSNYKGKKDQDLSKGQWYLNYLTGMRKK